jgi:Zn-dependent metalloprotease
MMPSVEQMRAVVNASLAQDPAAVSALDLGYHSPLDARDPRASNLRARLSAGARKLVARVARPASAKLTQRSARIGATVHLGSDYSNAWWDNGGVHFGSSDGWNNAAWRYTDGDDVHFESFSDLTTPAHMLHHGITEAKAPLSYREQSGALNEGPNFNNEAWTELAMTPNFDDHSGDWDLGADTSGTGSLFANAQTLPKSRPASLRLMNAPGSEYTGATKQTPRSATER